MFNIRQLISCFIVTGLFSLTAEANTENMMKDLEAAKYNISIKYAPASWKEQLNGWKLNTAFDEAKSQIQSGQINNIKAYQRAFKKFFGSMQDYHVKTLFYSTEWSWFPIKIQGVKGHYFFRGLSGIELTPEDLAFADDNEFKKLEKCKELMNFKEGDEILAINDIPVQEVIENIIDEELNGDRTDTGYALAAEMLFLKRGKYGENIPTGFFELTVLHKDNEAPSTYHFPWIHIDEWVKDVPETQPAPSPFANYLRWYDNKPAKPLETAANLMRKNYSVTFAQELNTHKYITFAQLKKQLRAFVSQADEEEDEDMREKGFLPDLGNILWQTEIEKDLYAYLFENDQGIRIGYLRVPTFSHFGQDANLQIKEIANTLELFNQHSEALILDITNNPGGNLMYMMAVLSLLTDKPLKSLPHREILIQQDVYNAAVVYNTLKNMLSEDSEEDIAEAEKETLDGYTITKNAVVDLMEYFQYIIHSWETDQRFTEPAFPFGMREVLPHPDVQYNKPIIVLINELDFSCGDLFPAILQDNKRAILFGNKTAGAGGYVRAYPCNSRFGVQAFSLTGSLIFRLDGSPIENLGVTPDIPYKLTENDLRNNYIDYKTQLNQVINETLLNKP